jgi:epsilon-lactone hydrolase
VKQTGTAKGADMPSAEIERACTLWREMWPQKDEPTVEDFRDAYEKFTAQFPVPDDVTTENVDADGVPALWVRTPQASTDRTIFYLHGGGYVIGTAHGYRELAAHLGRAAEAQVLVVDYRLAPEHPFPAAVDDAVSAYRWLLDTGVAPGSVVIAGDSAGGGLTMATLLALRDAGAPLPAAGVGLSPWVDLECTGETMTTKADVDPVVQREGVLGMAAMYLGGLDAQSPLASPLHGDLSGLPPLLIQVGTRETLLDDAIRLAARAEREGVDVTLETVEEAPHVWHVFSSFLPEARDSIDQIAAFTRKHTA